jgi:hypothetical protein
MNAVAATAFSSATETLLQSTVGPEEPVTVTLAGHRYP